ncbi:MAG: hypothetical protein CMM81_06645 [Rhodospirillales bacterium]|nr:hypothetical protein [Rhodospirillales bacterium]
MLAYESIPNLPTLFFERASKFKDTPFLWAKSDGRWRPSTWKQVAERVTKFAYGLKQLGVKPGDRVLIVSENRPEWMITDLAIMAIGAVAVPAYTTNTVSNHRHIIQDSGATLAICSLAPLSQRVMQAAEGSDLKTLITMEWPGSLPQGLKLHGWDDVLGMAERAKGITPTALAEE